MRLRWMKRAGLAAIFAGAAASYSGVVLAEDDCCPPQRRLRIICPPQCPPQCETPSEKQPTKPDDKKPPQTQQPSVDLSLQSEQAAAFGSDTVALAAPNMLGNLLGAGNSTSFFYQRLSGSVFINGTGSTNVINPKVADNNSPLPQDRIAFRYNFFNDALKVVGDSGQVVLDPSLGVSRNSAPRFRGLAATRSYDVHDYTFSAEKTFWGGRVSAELRVPFTHSLSHDLSLSVADVTGIGPDNDGDSNSSIIQTTSTPQNTLGKSDTEFGNMALILKGLVYQSDRLVFSAGTAVGIPTARDNHIRVIDFLGDGVDNDIEIQRLRDFRVSNDTWSLSPFFAALVTPSEHFFAHGFMQFDFPVGTSGVNYREFALVNTETSELQLGDENFHTSIRDQILMQTDLGIGYWLVKRKGDFWITGVIPTLELHYTTTLDNAQVRSLPLAPRSAGLQVVTANGLIPEPNPTVGNLRNRLDLLDMTVGTTFVLGERTTMATGVAFPLKTGDDRTFNWEFQFQLNYYFGGGKTHDRGGCCQ